MFCKYFFHCHFSHRVRRYAAQPLIFPSNNFSEAMFSAASSSRHLLILVTFKVNQIVINLTFR